MRLIKLKSLLKYRILPSRQSNSLQNRKNIITNSTSDRELISKIYKEIMNYHKNSVNNWGIDINIEYSIIDSEVTEKQRNFQHPLPSGM